MRHILLVFFVTAGLMLFIFSGADWYATNSAMPRYCEKPSETLSIVQEILTSEAPSEGKEKRPYIVAAKLIFLVPQFDGESVDDYISRLKSRISDVCGVRY